MFEKFIEEIERAKESSIIHNEQLIFDNYLCELIFCITVDKFSEKRANALNFYLKETYKDIENVHYLKNTFSVKIDLAKNRKVTQSLEYMMNNKKWRVYSPRSDVHLFFIKNPLERTIIA